MTGKVLLVNHGNALMANTLTNLLKESEIETIRIEPEMEKVTAEVGKADAIMIFAGDYVYDSPELTPAQRHEVWRALIGEYMPWVRLDGKTPFFGDGKHWQRQSHIYEEPFYYIDYGLAQTAAFGFAGGGRDALNAYLAFARAGGTETFSGLLKLAGLPSPFEAETLAAVRRSAEDLLTQAGRL